ncbi:thiamine phosphate synthase [Kordiimonas aquimaris]|uniref:thiamine phosphate synthase n=1 Tax=Kordiimonas aquimaris TaxID=707591 RepID=UPI0021D06C31|nr:thiamine phosphate synthase [Kordiimonas aquimaris]
MVKAPKSDRDEVCELYLITPAQIDDAAAFAKTLSNVLATGFVACVQLRLKDVSDEEIISVAKVLMPVCHEHDVAFILNDRADLAAELDADGVHLGQHDGDIKTARALLGHDKDIGVTCHDSKHLAYEAGDAGADYVAFGAFFDTNTKQTEFRPDLELLTVWDEITDIPCVAIGGITVENCRKLADAGAHFVAVSSGVWDYAEGPVAAVRTFNQALA